MTFRSIGLFELIGAIQIIEGIPIAIVVGRASHFRASTTIDTYAHFLKSAGNETSAALNGVFATCQ